MRRHFLLGLALAGMLTVSLPAMYAGRQSTLSAAATATLSAPISASERAAAEHITAAQLKEYLYYVASDKMEGRDTPSRGLDATARYIAEHLAAWGVKPAGDNHTYFQKIVLRRDTVDTERTRAEIGGRTFVFAQDFLVGRTEGTISGPLVYVGDGWVVNSKNINSYKGVDVRDKIMIVAGGGRPKGLTPQDLQGKKGVDWYDPATYARTHGARGLIVIPHVRDIEHWWLARRASLDKGIYQVERFQEEDNPQVPAIIPSAEMLNTLFAGERVSGTDILKRVALGEPGEAFDLSPGKRASFTISLSSETATTQNVVAVLEGNDPILKHEYVAIGAHYDHVGVGQPVNGDSIYNGADDDGSGTVSVMALADAFAHGPRPKRSILFVWHCGEEKGLWGSRYFTENPTVPLDRVVTQLNIDMIGRSKKPGDTKPANRELTGPNEIYVIGSRMMSTDLGELSERVNREYLNLSFNYRYDDPNDPNRFFFRSDHFNYAQKGIPIIFYFDGVHEDYHQPSDSPDKIDYQKMQKVARTIFVTASELANAPARPRVDKQLPPELTGR